ncbi:hypothetical protein EVAR_967_1 [Eumeta japonica]|uniref:Uncharacterized protein n=1 Tax=Eumeta variegata TaxID=151549 RepID=A0A4C1SH12_EUMVA|nr:hypothetical protein EVAR_967_1 [Eumeta japonica]
MYRELDRGDNPPGGERHTSFTSSMQSPASPPARHPFYERCGLSIAIRSLLLYIISTGPRPSEPHFALNRLFQYAPLSIEFDGLSFESDALTAAPPPLHCKAPIYFKPSNSFIIYRTPPQRAHGHVPR